MKKFLLSALFALCAGFASGQINIFPALVHSNGAPVGACVANTFDQNDLNGALYTCVNGVWTLSSGTGNVTTTGSPASPELVGFSGPSSITNVNLSGDVTTNNTTVTTVAAIQGTTVTLASPALGQSLTFNNTPALVNAYPGIPVDTRSSASSTVTGDGTGSDRGSLFRTTNNTTSTAVSLPQAGSTGFGSNIPFVSCNSGTVISTITPTTSTINGNSTLKLQAKPAGGNPECAFVYSDNANYYAGEVLPTDVNGQLPVNSIAGITSTQGNGAKLQLSTGTATANFLVKFDANGNTINSGLQENSSVITSNAATQSVTYGGGGSTTFGGVGTIGGVIISGGNLISGVGASAASSTLITAGNNQASNLPSMAGGVEIIPGASTNATQGLQGLISLGPVYVKGTTVTLWNLQCESASMTVADCAATPNNWVGVAEQVNTNTIQLFSTGQTFINASAAVTLGHTVCAGLTAGQVTDSGGTATCTNAQGSTVGIVMAVGGAWTLPDGTTVTATTTLPLIQFNAASRLSAGATTFDLLGGGTNVNQAFVVGSASGTVSSMVPSGAGQITGITTWLSPGGAGLFAPQPAVTGALTGGHLGTGQTLYIQITINQGANSSWPSLELAFPLNSGNNCGSGSVCSATVTAPTLTGTQTYTVYSCASGGGGGCEKQQTALAACVNITSNCVIDTAGTGAVPTLSDTTGIIPSVTSASECPPDVDASGWMRDSTGSGSYHTAFGIDRSVGWGLTGVYPAGQRGWLEFCRPVIFNRSGVQPYATVATSPMTANGSMLVFNQFSSTNVFGMQIQGTVPSSATGSWTTQLEGIYSEMDVLGSPNFSGLETNVGAIRGTTTTLGSPTYGGAQLGQAVGVSGASLRQNGSTPTCGAVACYVGVQGQAQNLGATSGNGWIYVGVLGQGNDFPSHDTTGKGYAIYAKAPTQFFPATTVSNVGFESDNFTNCAGCWDMFLSGSVGDPTQGQGYMMGNLVLPGLKGNAGAISVLGSFVLTGGSVSTGQIALAPPGPNVSQVGTPGSTTDVYLLVAKDGAGGSTAAGTTTSTSAANAVLDTTNYNHICTNPSPDWRPTGVSSWDVYRTTAGGTPSTTGKIGSMTYTATYLAQLPCFDDKGIAADGTVAPTSNTTGNIVAAGPSVNTSSGPVSGAWKCVNVTPVTVSANVATDQNLMTCTLPANTLNSVGKTLRIWLSGVYSTEAANTSTLTIKAKLGSITLATITTSANAGGVTTRAFNESLLSTTQTAGTSAVFEAHGNLAADLTVAVSADSIFTDTNIAVSSTLDSTASQTLQITGTFSVAGVAAGNIFTQRQLIAETVD